jgi:D-beta-D-heptose 7-phosphate kinase/D-beta-D-heptose 1-phosphate adenosyltransferase
MTTLANLPAQLAGRRVAVVGDLMLDHFQFGRVDRISPEAPVPVVRFERDEYRLGGAANVAHNVVAVGGRAELVGVVGRDEAAAELRRHARAAGIDDRAFVEDPARPTTRKTRIVTSRNQQVARLDHEVDRDVSGAVLGAVRSAAARAISQADAVVLSDYRKGVVTATVIEEAIRGAAGRVPVLVDPKVPDALRYRGATLITPNHHEAELMTSAAIRTPDDVRAAARRLHDHTGASILITWGEHGMWVLDAGGPAVVEAALPAEAREVSDVTGAGDTVIAVLAVALAAGASLVDAARLANTAAGLVVARFGPAAVTHAELDAAFRAAAP